MDCKGFGRKRWWPNSKVGLLSLQSSGWTEENRDKSEDSWSPGSECEAGVLTTRWTVLAVSGVCCSAVPLLGNRSIHKASTTRRRGN
jgi:hypothetical protein